MFASINNSRHYSEIVVTGLRATWSRSRPVAGRHQNVTSRCLLLWMAMRGMVPVTDLYAQRSRPILTPVTPPYSATRRLYIKLDTASRKQSPRSSIMS